MRIWVFFLERHLARLLLRRVEEEEEVRDGIQWEEEEGVEILNRRFLSRLIRLNKRLLILLVLLLERRNLL